MELIQIIVFSLKLFTAATLVIVTISYAVYKFKSRTRLKPYMRPGPKGSQVISIKIEEDSEPKKTEKPKRFVVLNEKNSKPAEGKVKKSEEPSVKPKPGVIERVESDHQEEIKSKEKLNKEKSNIYSYYSEEKSGRMHKLKLAEIRH